MAQNPRPIELGKAKALLPTEEPAQCALTLSVESQGLLSHRWETLWRPCVFGKSLRLCRKGLPCSGSSTRIAETAYSFAARDVPHLAAKPREAFPDPPILYCCSYSQREGRAVREPFLSDYVDIAWKVPALLCLVFDESASRL